MPQGKRVETQGFQNNTLPLSFWQQPQPTGHLALVFPGLGYHTDLPVLYYPALQLYATGADVLRLRFHYDLVSGFMQQPDAAMLRWLAADAAAVLDFGLRQHGYTQITLIGKSLGTIALAGLLASRSDLDRAACLWLTPILSNASVRMQLQQSANPGLVAIGTADPYYDPAIVDKLGKQSNLRCLVLPGADHSLETPGDALAAVRAMEKLVEGIAALIAP